MFTKSCFIRKNTYELRLKLELIGYNVKYVKLGSKYLQISWIPGYVLSGDEEDLNHNSNTYIDCGDNEELFLAIAALRDDTDKYQWFIAENINNTQNKLWFFCIMNKIEDMLYSTINHLKVHKANVEELIEHFTKNKKII